jgi:AraC-like DNA-binding protein
MQECVDNKEIRKYVHHFGVKIHKIYPKLMGVSDAKNELWVAVFRAIKERYNPKKPLIQFVRNAVFSQYGSFARERGNASRLLNERATSNIKVSYDDPSFDKINTTTNLERIKNDLEARASASRQYRYAVRIFGLLRQGVTIKECCQRLHISKPYGYRIFQEIICECGRKYREETISIG